MHPPATGELALQLPWLWPDAHSLMALTEPMAEASWLTVRRDPAALLLLHGYGSSPQSSTAPPRNSRDYLLEPRPLVTVLDWFAEDQGSWIDWSGPQILPVYRTALAIAHTARRIAIHTRRCNADAAWTAGLLAPLGWFAVASIDPDSCSQALSDPLFDSDPREVERRLWTLDSSEIARRITRQMQLPDWLRVVLGHLSLPIAAAVQLGADADLFATIQLAVSVVAERGHNLGMSQEIDQEAVMVHFAIPLDDLRTLQNNVDNLDFAEIFEPTWQDPRTRADLPDLFRNTLAHRQAEAAPFLAPLERDIDRLHRLLVVRQNQEEDRLQNAKLAALAEFAAGASHEINNPLAVISGQGQYLLHRESDERRQKALQSIIRQTQRIHAILTELMYFARPPKPQKQGILLAEIVQFVIDGYRPMATELGVRLESIIVESTLRVEGDRRLLQTALGCLVRNGIEAVAAETGWVHIQLESLKPGRADMIVEDSGPGIAKSAREHLFDPFFSGRTAGRGRGLGLPTAWRLAQEHGGDVRYIVLPGGPTRFVLSLPILASDEGFDKRLIA